MDNTQNKWYKISMPSYAAKKHFFFLYQASTQHTNDTPIDKACLGFECFQVCVRECMCTAATAVAAKMK